MTNSTQDKRILFVERVFNACLFFACDCRSGASGSPGQAGYGEGERVYCASLPHGGTSTESTGRTHSPFLLIIINN